MHRGFRCKENASRAGDTHSHPATLSPLFKIVKTGTASFLPGVRTLVRHFDIFFFLLLFSFLFFLFFFLFSPDVAAFLLSTVKRAISRSRDSVYDAVVSNDSDSVVIWSSFLLLFSFS